MNESRPKRIQIQQRMQEI